MPRGDGTGPMAMGSGTGRGMGFCSGADAPGYASASGNRGFRCCPGRGGRGRGGWGGRGPIRGARRQGTGMMGAGGIWQGPADPQLERNQLQQQVAAMESNLESMKARLAALEKDSVQG